MKEWLGSSSTKARRSLHVSFCACLCCVCGVCSCVCVWVWGTKGNDGDPCRPNQAPSPGRAENPSDQVVKSLKERFNIDLNATAPTNSPNEAGRQTGSETGSEAGSEPGSETRTTGASGTTAGEAGEAGKVGAGSSEVPAGQWSTAPLTSTAPSGAIPVFALGGGLVSESPAGPVTLRGPTDAAATAAAAAGGGGLQAIRYRRYADMRRVVAVGGGPVYVAASASGGYWPAGGEGGMGPHPPPGGAGTETVLVNGVPQQVPISVPPGYTLVKPFPAPLREEGGGAVPQPWLSDPTDSINPPPPSRGEGYPAASAYGSEPGPGPEYAAAPPQRPISAGTAADGLVGPTVALARVQREGEGAGGDGVVRGQLLHADRGEAKGQAVSLGSGRLSGDGLSAARGRGAGRGVVVKEGSVAGKGIEVEAGEAWGEGILVGNDGSGRSRFIGSGSAAGYDISVQRGSAVGQGLSAQQGLGSGEGVEVAEGQVFVPTTLEDLGFRV